MPNVTTYDAKDCVITVNNTYITGLGEDMISGEKDEDFFTTNVGAQGDIIKNVTNNSLGTITLTLQATSPQKGFLMGLARQGAIFSIWAVNKSIGERMGGTKASILNYPELANGAEAEDREFTIQVFDYTVEEASN